MKRLILTLALLVFTVAPSAAATLFVLRHAEDFDEGRDPVLTELGERRAEELAAMLAVSGVEFVLSSDYHRTRDTVRPLASAAGIEVEIYDPRDLPGLVERLRERGGRGVVVGHSNTTPELVGLLGGEPGEPIDELEFDRLYIVHTDFADPAVTVQLRYGRALTSP